MSNNENCAFACIYWTDCSGGRHSRNDLRMHFAPSKLERLTRKRSVFCGKAMMKLRRFLSRKSAEDREYISTYHVESKASHWRNSTRIFILNRSARWKKSENRKLWILWYGDSIFRRSISFFAINNKSCVVDWIASAVGIILRWHLHQLLQIAGKDEMSKAINICGIYF